VQDLALELRTDEGNDLETIEWGVIRKKSSGFRTTVNSTHTCSMGKRTKSGIST